MQPNRDPSDWQQPTEQPSQAPYVANPLEESGKTPVVTMTPEAIVPNTSVTPVTSSVPRSTPPISYQTVSVDQKQEQGGGNDGEADPLLEGSTTQEEPVHWQAKEYIPHEKTPIWFVLFGIVVILFIVVAIFFMQSITFAILIPVMAAALLVYINRPPRVLDYTLSGQGLHINDRLYPFSQFKGFGVIHDGLEYSVMLIPMQRFKPGVSVYFPEEAGEAIVDMLGMRLPMQELHLDLFDHIVRTLRI